MANKLGGSKYVLADNQIKYGDEVLIENIGRMTEEQAQKVVDRLNGKEKNTSNRPK